MRRLILVPVVALVLAWHVSQAMAICAEGEALYFLWQDAVTQVNIAQIEVDNLEDAIYAKGVELVLHWQSHATCDESCGTAQVLRDSLTELHSRFDAAEYVLAGWIATEQQRWWDMAAHIDWCPEC